MGFLVFLLVFGIVLLILAGLVAFAAFMHKDVSGDYTPVNDLLEK